MSSDSVEVIFREAARYASVEEGMELLSLFITPRNNHIDTISAGCSLRNYQFGSKSMIAGQTSITVGQPVHVEASPPPVDETAPSRANPELCASSFALA